MYAYKFKGVTLEDDGLKIKLIERFKDGVYDKFVSPREIMEIIRHFVCYEEDFDSIMSKSELKELRKNSAQEQHDEREQSLFDDILNNMDYD